METKITATELARSLSDVLSRVRYRRERFLIERNGEPVATLAPAAPPSRATLQKLVDLMARASPVDDDFADDLERIQLSQPLVGPPRWR